MWRKKKPDEFAPAANPPEALPMTVQDLRPLGLRPTLGTSDTNSRLGKSLSFQGELKGTEDVYIDGEFAGTIELGGHSLTVGPEGRVRADIRAREIVIEGNVQGNLRAADRLRISKTGNVTGDLVAARIVIEDGAYFKGSIDISKPEVSKVAAPPRPPAVAAAAPTAPAAPSAPRQQTLAGNPADPNR